VGFFRRERPIHEQLADEAGLDIDGIGDELALDPEEPLPDEAALDIDGRGDYDEVFSLEAPDLPGDSIELVALPDGSLFLEEELPEGSPDAIADAITVPPPYHAFAARQSGPIWTVAVRRVAVVEVPEEIPGDEVEIVVSDEERSLLVDDVESESEIPSLEDFGAQLYGSFVLNARRLDETLWEVTVLPL
jgi:hypothetical protein